MKEQNNQMLAFSIYITYLPLWEMVRGFFKDIWNRR